MSRVGAIAALEMARVEWSVTEVLSPVASTRTQPVIVTLPEGGAGTSPGSAPWFAEAVQPRSTSRAVPSAVTSGTTTSMPDSPSWEVR